MNKLNKNCIKINRRILSKLAILDPNGFRAIVDIAD
jgi:ribosomal protein L20